MEDTLDFILLGGLVVCLSFHKYFVTVFAFALWYAISSGTVRIWSHLA